MGGPATGEQQPNYCDNIDPSPFTDIATGVHQEAIDCLHAHGITSGITATTFAPRGTATRAQMATFIVNTLAVSDAVELPAEVTNRFTDVDDDSAHVYSINALAELDIIQGRTSTTFAPGALVTRAQMATFMLQSYSLATGETVEPTDQGFQDIADDVHGDAINVIAALGITVGVTPTEYRPRENVRRDQMASFLIRLLHRIGAVEEPGEPPVQPEEPEGPEPVTLECGAVVAQNVTLAADVACEEGFTEPALTIGADDVRINLDGNSITIPGGTAILSDGFDGVTIDSGTLLVEGDWEAVGVEIYNAEDVTIRQVESAPIIIHNSQNVTVADSVIDHDGDLLYTVAITGSQDVSVSRNTIRSSSEWAVGIVSSQDVTVVSNEIPAYAGVDVIDGQDNLIAENNIVVGRRRGVAVRSGDGLQVQGNTVTGSDFFGLIVHARATNTLLDGNVSSGHDEDGIRVGSPSTTVQNNTANNNGGWGIWAVEDVIDGGGNTAADNSEGQCFNIECT